MIQPVARPSSDSLPVNARTSIAYFTRTVLAFRKKLTSSRMALRSASARLGIDTGVRASPRGTDAPDLTRNESAGFQVRCLRCPFFRVLDSARLARSVANKHEAHTQHHEVEVITS